MPLCCRAVARQLTPPLSIITRTCQSQSSSFRHHISRNHRQSPCYQNPQRICLRAGLWNRPAPVAPCARNHLRSRHRICGHGRKHPSAWGNTTAGAYGSTGNPRHTQPLKSIILPTYHSSEPTVNAPRFNHSLLFCSTSHNDRIYNKKSACSGNFRRKTIHGNAGWATLHARIQTQGAIRLHPRQPALGRQRHKPTRRPPHGAIGSEPPGNRHLRIHRIRRVAIWADIKHTPAPRRRRSPLHIVRRPGLRNPGSCHTTAGGQRRPLPDVGRTRHPYDGGRRRNSMREYQSLLLVGRPLHSAPRKHGYRSHQKTAQSSRLTNTDAQQPHRLLTPAAPYHKTVYQNRKRVYQKIAGYTLLLSGHDTQKKYHNPHIFPSAIFAIWLFARFMKIH